MVIGSGGWLLGAVKCIHKCVTNNIFIAGKSSDIVLFIFFCEAVDCGKLPPPMNGTLFGKETTYLNEMEINCDEGFILRGSRRRKCQADRNWSGDTTVCEGSKTL